MEFPKQLWLGWYNYLSKFDIQTMNYGYLKNKNKQIIDVNENSFMLYKKISNLDNLQLNVGDTILEVGCGRGGGLFYLAKQYTNYKFIGLDFSTEAINCANIDYKLPNLKYICGNAQALPFDDGSMSVILNIESSHCYPDFSKFMSETKRVLKKNGFFCYADFRNSFYEIQEYFEIMFVKDITSKVLNSLFSMKNTRQTQIQKYIEEYGFIDKLILKCLANEFSAAADSQIYNNLNNRTMFYTHIQALNIKNCSNSNNSVTHCPSKIFTYEDIKHIGDKQILMHNFINKVKIVNRLYKNMKPRNPLRIRETKLQYNKKLFKILSEDYTKPVIFKNCGIYVDEFKMDDNVQVMEKQEIKILPYNKKLNVFGQQINSSNFDNLNHVFGEEYVYYDYFCTRKGTVTGIHSELYSTFVLQVDGNKVWKLIDPKYSDQLIPFCTHLTNEFVYLSMNFGGENINGCKLPVYEVILEKGDMLFVPSWWWHQVVTITDSKHIEVRCIHEDTPDHHLLGHEFIHKKLSILQKIIQKPIQKLVGFNVTELQNSGLSGYINNGPSIINYYKENGVKFLT
jgi:ubiquinone/menaquinone biosynthesis C-methylase UbiE